MMCSHVSAKSHGRVSKALLTVVKTRTLYRKTRMFVVPCTNFKVISPNSLLSVFNLPTVLFRAYHT